MRQRLRSFLLINELHSTARTAELLNAEGMLRRPSRYDRTGPPRRWDSYDLRKMLKSESLMGCYTWAKKPSAKEQSFTVEIPAVLSESRWLELQAVLSKSERRPYAATNFELLTDEERLLALAPGGEEATRDASVAVKEIARIDALIAQKEKAITDRAAVALVAGLAPEVIAKAVEQIEGDLEVLREQRVEMASWHTETAESESRKERLRYFVKLVQVLMNPPLEVMHEVFRLLDVEVELIDEDGGPTITVRGQVTTEAVDQIGRRARDLSGIAC